MGEMQFNFKVMATCECRDGRTQEVGSWDEEFETNLRYKGWGWGQVVVVGS